MKEIDTLNVIYIYKSVSTLGMYIYIYRVTIKEIDILNFIYIYKCFHFRYIYIYTYTGLL